MSVSYSPLTLKKLLGSCSKQEQEIDVNFLAKKRYQVCLNLSLKISDF